MQPSTEHGADSLPRPDPSAETHLDGLALDRTTTVDSDRSQPVSADQATPNPEAFDARRLLLFAAPAAVVGLALLLGLGSERLAPHGLFGRPWQLLGWIVLAVLGGLHRPLGALDRPPGVDRRGSGRSTLGLGAAVVPALVARHGVVPAAVAAAIAFLGTEVARRALARRLGESPRAPGVRAVPSVERAFLIAAGVLTGGAWWAFEVTGTSSLGALWAVGIGVGAMAGLLVAAEHWRRGSGDRRGVLGAGALRRTAAARSSASDGAPLGANPETVALEALARRRSDGPPTPVARAAVPVALDAAGLLVGVALVALALAGGWLLAVSLWLAFALLAAEAARQALSRRLAEDTVHNLERLHLAHERILGETSGMGSIAQQVLLECRAVLPVAWYHFELSTGDAAGRGWAAGPDGFLSRGRPHPPARPGMLPGIHRRVDWLRFEQPLTRTGVDGEEVLAIVRLWCDPRQVEPGSQQRFASLVPQMAASVDRALLDREAKIDPLTGVAVRRVLEARLQRAFARSNEEGSPLSVILCDIDFFKKVNDTWGHGVGDQALIRVASVLEAGRREGDLCCRYGGEEFTLLLEDADGAAALELAERLRQAIEAVDFRTGDGSADGSEDRQSGERVPLTLSLGVACFPELHVKAPGELLLLADEALYRAKHDGRNRALLHRGNGRYATVEEVRRGV